MEVKLYDLCIVGAGMIGSSAARHASAKPGTKVCLIGPEEPLVRNTDIQSDIFGAYYDEGRITRSTDPDPIWATLAQRSIARYREIERLSGVKFYTEIGCLSIGTEGKKYITDTVANARIHGIGMDVLDFKALQAKFPYLNIPPEDNGGLEQTHSGYINPRKLVYAEQLLAQQQGCNIIRDVVGHVIRVVQSDGELVMKVITETGQIIYSKKVLLATGAFTTFRNVLGAEVIPDIDLCPLTVALLEISESDAQKLRSMPPVIYKGRGLPGWCKRTIEAEGEQVVLFYMLPAIRYPDGKYYLKLGLDHSVDPVTLSTAEDVKRWYCNKHERNSPELVQDAASQIKAIVKGLKMLSFHGDFCVIAETPTGRPYIDMFHSHLGVAIGGNGYAAKSCDEIGRLAVAMVLAGKWDSDIPKEALALRFRMTPIPHAKL